jgi:predicted RNase H-like HicB family nuclease
MVGTYQTSYDEGVPPFRYRIVVTWSEEEKLYVGRVPAIAGCRATGETPAQAAREVHSSAEAVLDIMRQDGDPLPSEDVPTGEFKVR